MWQNQNHHHKIFHAFVTVDKFLVNIHELHATHLSGSCRDVYRQHQANCINNGISLCKVINTNALVNPAKLHIKQTSIHSFNIISLQGLINYYWMNWIECGAAFLTAKQIKVQYPLLLVMFCRQQASEWIIWLLTFLSLQISNVQTKTSWQAG